MQIIIVGCGKVGSTIEILILCHPVTSAYCSTINLYLLYIRNSHLYSAYLFCYTVEKYICMEVYVKVQNIKDVDAFFKVIDECKGTVELVSPEGDRINLKSKLTQYLSMANIFSNGYIKELDLVAHDKEDVERIIKFMYQGE